MELSRTQTQTAEAPSYRCVIQPQIPAWIQGVYLFGVKSPHHNTPPGSLQEWKAIFCPIVECQSEDKSRAWDDCFEATAIQPKGARDVLAMVEPVGAGTLSQWHSSCMLSGHVKARTRSNPPCQSHWSRHLPCKVTPTRSNVRTRLWSDVDYPWSGLAVCSCWNMASSSQWERVSLGWRSFIHRHQYKGTYHGTNWCSWVPPQERKKHQPVFSESSWWLWVHQFDHPHNPNRRRHLTKNHSDEYRPSSTKMRKTIYSSCLIMTSSENEKVQVHGHHR